MIFNIAKFIRIKPEDLCIAGEAGQARGVRGA